MMLGILGTLVVLGPYLLAPVLLTWFAVVLLTGYVGLSTMLAAVSAPLYLAVARLPEEQPLFIYCTAMAMYIIFSHRSNIRRMLAGTENRMTRAMLSRKSHRQ